MSRWIYRLVPTRPEMAGGPTLEEQTVMAEHVDYLEALTAAGILVLAGRPEHDHGAPGITIFEAPDEAAARRFMDEDPVIAGGFASGELRPFRVSLLRGRD